MSHLIPPLAYTIGLIYAILKARTTLVCLIPYDLFLVTASSHQRSNGTDFFKPFVLYLQLTYLPIKLIYYLLLLVISLPSLEISLPSPLMPVSANLLSVSCVLRMLTITLLSSFPLLFECQIFHFNNSLTEKNCFIIEINI